MSGIVREALSFPRFFAAGLFGPPLRFSDNLVRMSTSLTDFCRAEIAALKDAKTWKKERVLEGPTGARVRVDGGDVLMLTSNNYLGFANHPRIVQAAKNALEGWGNGLGSVRFICGTQALHRSSRRRSRAFSAPKTRSSIC